MGVTGLERAALSSLCPNDLRFATGAGAAKCAAHSTGDQKSDIRSRHAAVLAGAIAAQSEAIVAATTLIELLERCRVEPLSLLEFGGQLGVATAVIGAAREKMYDAFVALRETTD